LFFVDCEWGDELVEAVEGGVDEVVFEVGGGDVFLDVSLETESFLILFGWWGEFDGIGFVEVVDEGACGPSVGVLVSVCGFSGACGNRSVFFSDQVKLSETALAILGW
jgi:hypothetical protein